jgi:hypothetical protein
VNRRPTEDRRAFAERLEEIHTGAECERLAGKLSALTDGEDLALSPASRHGPGGRSSQSTQSAPVSRR